VIFHPSNEADPQAVRPAGRVGADGSFTLTTYAAGDGAPAGDYTVVVIWTEGGSLKKVAPRDLLAGRYNTTAVSPLRAHVEAAKNDLPPFELN
jgi:hypothetical protein